MGAAPESLLTPVEQVRATCFSKQELAVLYEGPWVLWNLISSRFCQHCTRLQHLLLRLHQPSAVAITISLVSVCLRHRFVPDPLFAQVPLR